MGSHRVTKVNDGNVVAVVFGCDGSVVSHDIALGVGGHEGHSGGTGIFNVRVKPKCSFTYTCRTDHHTVNIACVYESNCILSYSFTTYNDTLFLRPALGILTPLAWLVRDFRIGVLDLTL